MLLIPLPQNAIHKNIQLHVSILRLEILQYGKHIVADNYQVQHQFPVTVNPVKERESCAPLSTMDHHSVVDSELWVLLMPIETCHKDTHRGALCRQ